MAANSGAAMTVKITVSYPDADEQTVLGFTFGISDLTPERAESLRPQIDFAISRLFMANERCRQLMDIASKRRS